MTITGSERLGWDQQLSSDDELQQIRFGIYIDQAASRTELASAACAQPQNQVAVCSSPLPLLSAGRHTLAMVSYYAAEGEESPRSASLTVNRSVTSVSTSVSPPIEASPTPGATLTDCAVGVLDVRRAIAVFPTGEMRVMKPETRRQSPLTWTSPGEEWTLRAAVGHPQFASNHLVFALLLRTESDVVRLAAVRFRELGGVLGERAIIYQDVLDSLPERPRLRFGPDGKLYVLLLSGAETAKRLATGTKLQERAFLIRLNEDGTVPQDNPSRSGFVGPLAIAPFAAEWIGDDIRGPLVTIGTGDGSFAVTSSKMRPPVLATLSLRRGIIPIALHATALGMGQKFPADLWMTDSEGFARHLSAGSALRLLARDSVMMFDTILLPDRTIGWCGTAPQADADRGYVSGLTKLPS